MESLRTVARRHPRAIDAALALALALIGLPGSAAHEPSPGAWLCYGLIFLPLVWRRRAPFITFWLVFATWTLADLWTNLPSSVIALPVAIYTLALCRPVRYLWPVIAAVELSLLGAVAAGEAPWAIIGANAIVAATLLLGTNIRTRRAYLAALEERARRLEHERDQRARLAVAAERTRIAREMHDIVAHNLSVIVALADAAALTAATAPQGATDKMEKVAATGREALGEMRRLLGVLHDDGPASGEPGDLVPQPGLGDIGQLIDQVRAAGLSVTLTRTGVPGTWSHGAGLALYRIVQEALTNTLKHAGPEASAHVRLRFAPDLADVEITDDGPSGVPEVVGGRGLAGMAERAASYGGEIEAGPLSDGGWRVHAVLRFEGADA